MRFVLGIVIQLCSNFLVQGIVWYNVRIACRVAGIRRIQQLSFVIRCVFFFIPLTRLESHPSSTDIPRP